MRRALLKTAVWALCLTPFALLVWRGFHDALGANPIETVTHATGDWTLRLLLATLAITPLRTLTGVNELARYRRLLGLFAFFYAALHLLTYVWLDKFFDFHGIVRDVVRRPFIAAGMTAFVLLLPLAVTSTAGWIRRLGGRGWRWLHRLVYVAAAAGVAHYYWLVKSDVRLPVMYGVALAVLLLARTVVRPLHDCRGS